MDFILEHYLWIKVIHIVFVITWMAGLFYLPRLFVYHTEYLENAKMLEIMEEKLFKRIMQPSMHIAIFTGILLLLGSGNIMMLWVHAKLTCVILLIVFHFTLDRWRKQLKAGVCSKSSKFFRITNEIPAVILILIITFVIIKPF